MDKSGNRVDNLLLALGATGVYQIIQMFVSISPHTPAAFQLLSNVFTCTDVPHQCAPPNDNSSFFERFKDMTNVTYSYKTCYIEVKSNEIIVAEEPCLFGMDYSLSRDVSAVSTFDLVCERKSLAKLSQTLVIAGQGIGAVATTIVSDRFGRKIVLLGSNLGLLVCGLAIAYAPNYLVFALFKFLVGCCQQGVVCGLFTFNSELFPTTTRRFNAVSGGMSWGMSVCLIPLVSYLGRDLGWRQLQAVYCLASLTVILQICLMDESIRWLLANGMTKKAKQVIKRAAKFNRKDFGVVWKKYEADSEVTPLNQDTSDPHFKTNALEASAKKMSLLDLLRVRRLLINALSIWFGWFTTALGFFTIYMTATSLAGDPYVNFFLTALMEIPSNFFFYFCLNRMGRKFTTIVPFLFLAGGLLIRGALQSLEPSYWINIFILVCSMAAMAGASGCFSILFAYTPEMFPTNIRNQALGVSSFVGRIGGMLAPFTSILAEQVVWGPAVFIGCCACLVVFLLRFVPETNGRVLPQTLDDLLAWYQKDETNNGDLSANGKDKNGHITPNHTGV